MDWLILREKLQKIWRYTRLTVYMIAALWTAYATLYLVVDIFQRRFGLFK